MFRDAMIALLLAGVAGCGVFDVRPVADAAVEAWATDQGETDPCRLDAMQHCVGAALAADRYGPLAALLLGYLNELDQAEVDAMDVTNNQAGLTCSAGCTDTIVRCCADLLEAAPSLLQTDGRCE